MSQGEKLLFSLEYTILATRGEKSCTIKITKIQNLLIQTVPIVSMLTWNVPFQQDSTNLHTGEYYTSRLPV